MIVIKEHAKLTESTSCYNIYNTKTGEYIQEIIPKKDLDDFKMSLGVAAQNIIRLDAKKLTRSEHNNFYKNL